MPGILSERVIAYLAAVLGAPLGRPQVHAYRNSMSLLDDRHQTTNSCAHMFSRENGPNPVAISRKFNDLYQPSLTLTDCWPATDTDPTDAAGLVDQCLPSRFASIEDIGVGLEDAVR